MEDRIKRILTHLETVRQDLLELSDDIWLNIDHNVPEALDAGCEFKRDYNERLAEFERIASAISTLVQGYTRVKVDEATPTAPSDQNAEERQRIIRDLDRNTPYTLDHNFTYTRPYGFRVAEYAANDLLTWRQLYAAFCKVLAAKDPPRFGALPDNQRFILRRKQFSREETDLRDGLLIEHGVYAEVHMSANSLRDIMRRLLEEFGMEQDDLKIYLRQDRDAEDPG